MIKNSLKRSLAVILAGSVLFGFTACLDFGGGKKAVVEAADTLASDMASASASKLIKNSTLDKKSSEAAALTELLDGDSYSDDQKAFFKAVEGTIEYEVDEASCTVNKGAASIDIVFTIADYEKVLKDEYTDINALTSAVKKADTKEITFTAEFVQEDKEWLPDNVGSKKFMKLYDYRNAEFTLDLTAEMIASFIDRNMSSFWLTNNGVYLDTPFIEFDYYFDSKVLDYEARENYVYYVLIKDGTTIFESDDILFGSSTNIPCKIETTDVNGMTDVFDAGSYTIQLLTEDGDMIDSESIDVQVTQRTNPTGNGGGNGGNGGGSTSAGEGVYFDYYDQTFKQYVIEADWYDYDSCMTDDNVYTSDVQTIAFSIQVTPDCNKSLTYFYAWTDQESSDGIKDALNNPLYTNTVTPNTYTNGTFYDLDYEVNGNAKAGYYIIVVADASTNDIILYGYCEVS